MLLTMLCLSRLLGTQPCSTHFLDTGRRRKEFIISDLDETTLLINPAYVDDLRTALKKYADDITFVS